ncbi:MAG: TauD/TfdA family dioxygenase [Sneathiellaceae bacterium]
MNVMANRQHALSVTPLRDRTFGATVEGVRLDAPDAEQIAAIKAAWLDHALLIFPGQQLDDAAQMAFAKCFGTLVPELSAVQITNVLPDGRLREAPDDDMMKIIRGNMFWHQDNTYMPLQAKGAVFSARVVPKTKGETGFADMRAAYDALDDATKARIEGLAAHHSLAYSQAKLGEQTKSEDSEYFGYGLNVAEAPLRPLVKVHPETGRRTLAVGRHAFGIPGLDEAESEALVQRLIDHAVADPARVYLHSWRPGDVVLWDNRCLMHKACPWDYSEPRIMVHSRIAGDPATESGLPTG